MLPSRIAVLANLAPSPTGWDNAQPSDGGELHWDDVQLSKSIFSQLQNTPPQQSVVMGTLK
jgi:hypothetical protein